MAHDDATVIRLRDGRELAFAEYGDPHGVPVFGFHGTPGSRRQLAPTGGARPPAGIRLIAPDRPGYGLSSFQRDRRLTDWPGDVSAIAEHLGLSRYGVLGVSGGGPHALACAHAFGDRLLGVACVSGVGPLDRPEAAEGMMPLNRALTALARRAPVLLRIGFRLQLSFTRRFPERAIDQIVRQLPEPDQRLLEDTQHRRAFESELTSASPRAARAAAQDFELFSRDWGFRLADISTHVHFWQGDLDRNVPPEHARLLSGDVPQSTLYAFPGEGHFLALERLPEILSVASGKALET